MFKLAGAAVQEKGGAGSRGPAAASRADMEPVRGREHTQNSAGCCGDAETLE